MRKSKVLPGKGDDKGKFYKCWHCGFIIDSSKHPTTGHFRMELVRVRVGTRDPTSGSGAMVTTEGDDFITTEDGYIIETEPYPYVGETPTLDQLDVYTSDPIGNCPFCGVVYK